MNRRSLARYLWYGGLHQIVRLTAVLAYRIRYTGIHNIPAKGPVLLISNHQSHFDPPLVGMGSHRQMNYLARDSLFRFAPFRWLCLSLGAIPLDRKGVGLGGIKESLRRLKRGEIVAMFPEGTRTRDGEIGPFHPGFTTLAVRANAAILPVAIEGAFAAWPRWQGFPRLGTIHVHYGVPILPEEFQGRNDRELLAEVHRRVCQCQAHVRQHPLFRRQRALRQRR